MFDSHQMVHRLRNTTLMWRWRLLQWWYCSFIRFTCVGCQFYKNYFKWSFLPSEYPPPQVEAHGNWSERRPDNCHNRLGRLLRHKHRSNHDCGLFLEKRLNNWQDDSITKALGSSINDVTHIWTILNPLSPSSYKIIDSLPHRGVTSFMDDS